MKEPRAWLLTRSPKRRVQGRGAFGTSGSPPGLPVVIAHSMLCLRREGTDAMAATAVNNAILEELENRCEMPGPVLRERAGLSIGDFYKAILQLESDGKHREAAALFRRSLGGTSSVSALLGLEP